MSEDNRITVVIPAFNEEETIGQVVADIKKAEPDWEILVIDDGSTDDTSEVAKRSGARVIRHPYNRGYGAALKTGIKSSAGEILVFMDADGQHNSDDIYRLMEYIGEYDMVIGARVGGSHTIFMRGWGNQFLNILASYLAGVKIEDLTSGFRAVKRGAIARFINLLPNGYSPSATSTLAFFEEGYAVKYVPITTHRRAGGKSQVRLLRDGVKFMAIIMRMIILFEPLKVFIPVSIILFLIGLFRFFHSLLKYRIASDIGILLMTAGVFIFFFGFLADQIAILRREIK